MGLFLAYSDAPNQVYSPAYIELNAGKFLDHEWVDISGLKQYLRRQTQNSGPAASTTHPFALSGSGSIASTRLSVVSDPVRVKIEAMATPASASLVKAEPQVISIPQSPAQIKMRTLNEDSQEVFELLSDSEADTDGRDSDLEVMEALQRTSRSSSTIPPCVTVDADDCPDDESECGTDKIFSCISRSLGERMDGSIVIPPRQDAGCHPTPDIFAQLRDWAGVVAGYHVQDAL
ncbi:hypothetical protein B0H10DRAFT_1959905 [Mycena sp. CBHHK59/15]|nr:hypothetical protein B0H10DRAFT_1959905 [Mycena sp. CBHHK59/15]